jgi:hypothetical protein
VQEVFFMNITEYAAHRGVSRDVVRNAIDTGRITATQDKRRWYIDPEVADTEWTQRTTYRGSDQVEVYNTPAVTEQYPTITESRAKTEYYKALLSELEYRVRSNRYVAVEEITRQQAAFARTLRDRILGVPDRVANLLAAEGDAQSIHALLTSELCIALEEVADALPA